MTEPYTLVPNRPDAEVAEDLRNRFKQSYEQHVLPLFNEAATQNFIIQVNVAMGPFGKMIIQQIQIMKQF